MRRKGLFIFLLIIMITTAAQSQEISDAKEKFEKRYKKAKQDFVDAEYEKVIAYYDSISSISRYTRITTYKMAFNSYQQLILKQPDEKSVLKIKADAVYDQALKWYGQMYLNEKWDKTVIDPEEENTDPVVIDKKPDYPGGLSAFYSYISDNLAYPTQVKQKGIEGRVAVTFIVNTDGSIDAVNVIRGLDPACDTEAVRVISQAGNFIPGSSNGEPQFVRMSIPINFVLTSSYEAKTQKRKKKRKKSRTQ